MQRKNKVLIFGEGDRCSNFIRILRGRDRSAIGDDFFSAQVDDLHFHIQDLRGYERFRTIGELYTRDAVAIIFIDSSEANKATITRSLPTDCQIINYDPVNMTPKDCFNHIATTADQDLLSDANITVKILAQSLIDTKSAFYSIPKDITQLITKNLIKCYFDNDKNSFMFFKSRTNLNNYKLIADKNKSTKNTDPYDPYLCRIF